MHQWQARLPEDCILVTVLIKDFVKAVDLAPFLRNRQLYKLRILLVGESALPLVSVRLTVWLRVKDLVVDF